MDGVEEDEYTSDPIAQQTRQVGVFLWQINQSVDQFSSL